MPAIAAAPLAAAIGGSAVLGAIAGDRASSKAAKAQRKASDTATAETRRAATEARGDINRIFPQAQQTAQEGFQGALDVFGQSLPAQANVFNQGNIGAQQAILAGLPQIQNALLGGNVDFSQMQPFQLEQPDLSFFQQTLPQIQARQAAEAAAAQQNQFASNAQQIGQGGINNIFGRNVNPGIQYGNGLSNFLGGRFNQIP